MSLLSWKSLEGVTMQIHLPFLSTGLPEIDKAFRIACGDVAGNIGLYPAAQESGRLKPVIMAGAAYPSPWVRDAAFNAWFAGLLAPDAARNGLLAMLRDSAWGIIPEEPQYWDTVIWSIGAWYCYLYTGDADFLREALPAIENRLMKSEDEELDPVDGLFRGGACFQDGIAAYPDPFVSADSGSGILHHLRNPRPGGAKPFPKGGGISLKALSTNCLYLEAYRIADQMRHELQLPKRHESKIRTLVQTIHRRFYLPATGTYRYLLDAADPCLERQEGLGHAFALLFRVVPPHLRQKLVNAVHTTAHGLPCVWPQYERYAGTPGVYARHSGLIWPQVGAAWCCALVAAGFRNEAWCETRKLAELASEDNMFHEIYHPETGVPYGGMQEDGVENGVRQWESCPRQTWAAAGYFQMILQVLFGLRITPKSLTLKPVLPEGVTRIELQGICWRNTIVNILVEQGEERMLVNGRKTTRFQPHPGETLEVLCQTDRRISAQQGELQEKRDAGRIDLPL